LNETSARDEFEGTGVEFAHGGKKREVGNVFIAEKKVGEIRGNK
jgi:hypothetical protein